MTEPHQQSADNPRLSSFKENATQRGSIWRCDPAISVACRWYAGHQERRGVVQNSLRCFARILLAAE
jgi:hypothetical protein